jgi:hypothetical protein
MEVLHLRFCSIFLRLILSRLPRFKWEKSKMQKLWFLLHTYLE